MNNAANPAASIRESLTAGHTVWLRGVGEGKVTESIEDGFRVAWRDGSASIVWSWEIGQSVHVSNVETT
jgi:hypothetical protein